MQVIGYCSIKKTATTGVSVKINDFLGKDVRVLEFNKDGDVLVINAAADCLATFDAIDVQRKFTCKVIGQVLIPPNLTFFDEMVYVGKVMSRKGGYNNLLREMVIQASLMKGILTDNFLFQQQ